MEESTLQRVEAAALNAAYHAPVADISSVGRDFWDALVTYGEVFRNPGGDPSALATPRPVVRPAKFGQRDISSRTPTRGPHVISATVDRHRMVRPGTKSRTQRPHIQPSDAPLGLPSPSSTRCRPGTHPRVGHREATPSRTWQGGSWCQAGAQYDKCRSFATTLISDYYKWNLKWIFSAGSSTPVRTLEGRSEGVPTTPLVQRFAPVSASNSTGRPWPS